MVAQRRCCARMSLSVSFLFFVVCGIAWADPAPTVKPFRYIVRTGDTPSRLASRWGLPQSLVSKSGQVLKIGETLSIPLVAREKISRGGSLSVLSGKYGVSVEMLAKFNRLKAPYRVRAGRVIMVPKLK